MTERDFISSCAESIKSEGIKAFPEDFIQFKEFDESNLPGKALVIGQEFFGSFEILSIDGSLILQASNYARAKFIIYSNRQKPASIKIPKSDNDIKPSINKYEEYLDSIIKRIDIDYKKKFPGSKNSSEVINNILRMLNLIRY